MPKQLSDKPYDNGSLKRLYNLFHVIFSKIPKGGTHIIYTSSGTYLLGGKEKQEIEKDLGLDVILKKCWKIERKSVDKLGEELKRRL